VRGRSGRREWEAVFVQVALTLLAAGAGSALLVPVTALGQSPFALVNIGADVRSPDARMEGRGGWGLAEHDTLNPAFKNPAGLAELNAVTILLSGYAENTRSETTDAGRKTRRTFTPNVRAAIPLRGGQLVLSTGFRARRATQYTTVSRLSVLFENQLLEYDEEFVRQGTQFDIPVTLSWRPWPRLGLAAGLNLVRGNTREILNEFFIFDVPSHIQEDEYTGTSSTLAMQLQPHPRLRLGATFTPGHGVEVKRRVQIENVARRGESSFRLEWPYAWAAGADYRIGEHWRCGADYEYSAFSQFRGREDWERDMVDEWSLYFGVERLRGSARRGAWGNLPLRLGASLHRWAYQVGGEDIRELRVAVGTGFPFRGNTGNLDIALSHGWIGDLDKNGLEDRVWRLSVSVTGMEKWW
jgi:hypothetical protein